MTGPAPARTRLSQNDLRKALRPAGFRNEDDLRLAEFPQLALRDRLRVARRFPNLMVDQT